MISSLPLFTSFPANSSFSVKRHTFTGIPRKKYGVKIRYINLTMLSCKKQTTAKYKYRNTPPYDANRCKVGTSRKGNNGFTYVVSSPNVNGKKRWMKKPAARSPRRYAPRRYARRPVRRTTALSRARLDAARAARDRAAAWRPRKKAPPSRTQARQAAAAWAAANLPFGPHMPET